MFRHTINTWLLAHLFHPFLFFGFELWPNPEELTIENGGTIFMISFFTVFVSIPALVLARMALYGISNLVLPVQEKFILWLIAIPAAILLNFLGLILVTDGIIRSNDLIIILPSVIAAVISILVRTRSFFRLQSNLKSVTS